MKDLWNLEGVNCVWSIILTKKRVLMIKMFF